MAVSLKSWYWLPIVEADEKYQQALQDVESLGLEDADGAIVDDARRAFGQMDAVLKTIDDKAKSLLAIVLGMLTALVAGVSTDRLDFFWTAPTFFCVIAAFSELLLTLRIAPLPGDVHIPDFVKMARAGTFPGNAWHPIHIANEARGAILRWRKKHFTAALWLLFGAGVTILIPLAIGP